ncbi:MAG: hypothetical protein OEY89_13880, partial [Gammaproteobacteria bacterium]|nr:hypothetical protein [Gammaproteobacteria bacterium]
PRPNVGAGETESWITFENGNLTWMWFQTIEGFDPGISRSNIFAADDYYDYYPGYDFYFEMVHEYNEDVAPALWLMADGGMSLSVPTPVSAVPLPASLLLFFLVL